MMNMRVHWNPRTGRPAAAPRESHVARPHDIDRSNIAFAGLLSSWQSPGHSTATLARRLPMRRIAERRG